MISEEQIYRFKAAFEALVANVEQAVKGKHDVIRLSWICLLAEGHLLLEDVPGTGKTSLARAIAQTVTGTFSRIQFTPDLLPSDVTGVMIYDQQTHELRFHPGPIFATVLLADEINRASPKTQSALLEVMEESQVTVDNESRPVGPPFIVIATQNPVEQAGVYPLPEAQLDRFLLRTSLGPPDHDTSVELLRAARTRADTVVVDPIIAPRHINDMVVLASRVHTSDPILSYIVRLAEETRRSDEVHLGVSMRGSLALARAAKVMAAANGRDFVNVDDVRALVVPVWAHRVIMATEAEFADRTSADVLVKILADIPLPSGS